MSGIYDGEADITIATATNFKKLKFSKKNNKKKKKKKKKNPPPPPPPPTPTNNNNETAVEIRDNLPRTSQMWSSSQMLSLSSANSQIHARRISTT